MDIWSRNTSRPKRSFEDMSQSRSIQPSSVTLGDFESATYSSEEDLNSLFVGRRRTSLSRNNSSHSVSRETAEQAQSGFQNPQQISSTQTVIDLTNDVEHVATQRPSNQVRVVSQEPLVGSGSTIGIGSFVDLTGDQENEESDDIIVTGQRRVILRRNISRSDPRPPFHNNPQRHGRSGSPSFLIPSRSAVPVVPTRYRFTAVRDDQGRLAVDLTRLGQMFSPHSIDSMPTLWHFGALQNMASHMDYGQGSHNRTPEHVPPPAARDNFTRSLTGSDTIICPSCEEELIQNKDEPLIKKGKKTISKKDREEHPFWVAKECGHVYCNRCFQSRGDRIKTTGFRYGVKPLSSRLTSRKPLLCAVDDCKSEIRAKDKWVGVFL
ncbi:putative cell cycle control protein [Golovinomyces cichoracearum]|uniref:Putative cell cycle control protein n=1 Tax=Golovinomyces cichoracearum TaxID=62708 RepID=A0A420J1W1_9PEZI|nr:putative cell cycle control protein [Golovinomyces cichoracearum]